MGDYARAKWECQRISDVYDTMGRIFRVRRQKGLTPHDCSKVYAMIGEQQMALIAESPTTYHIDQLGHWINLLGAVYIEPKGRFSISSVENRVEADLGDDSVFMPRRVGDYPIKMIYQHPTDAKTSFEVCAFLPPYMNDSAIGFIPKDIETVLSGLETDKTNRDIFAHALCVSMQGRGKFWRKGNVFTGEAYGQIYKVTSTLRIGEPSHIRVKGACADFLISSDGYFIEEWDNGSPESIMDVLVKLSGGGLSDKATLETLQKFYDRLEEMRTLAVHQCTSVIEQESKINW